MVHEIAEWCTSTSGARDYVVVHEIVEWCTMVHEYEVPTARQQEVLRQLRRLGCTHTVHLGVYLDSMCLGVHLDSTS